MEVEDGEGVEVLQELEGSELFDSASESRFAR
jgi:hypothetical protein